MSQDSGVDKALGAELGAEVEVILLGGLGVWPGVRERGQRMDSGRLGCKER